MKRWMRSVWTVVLLSPIALMPVTASAGAPTCDGHAATILGTGGSDVLLGTPGPDVIIGRGSDDTIRGRGGRDRICGGAGEDTLIGGNGNDRVFGGSGSDSLKGEDGNDELFGFGGIDSITGGEGDDVVDGGADDDGGIGVLNGGPGSDDVLGGPGDDDLAGEAGEDRLSGGDGNDNLDGGLDTDSCDQGGGTGTSINCEVADLAVDVESPPTAPPGQIVFTVTITNHGPSAVTFGLELDQDNTHLKCGDYPWEGSRDEPLLASGEERILEFLVTCSDEGDGSAVWVDATVIGPADPVTGNDTDRATTAVG